jgi:GNAT superfamily N-acetyltransferase
VTALHPEHDAVASEVRGWFTSSAPEIGYQVSRHWYGHLAPLGDGQVRLILDVGEPGQVPDALAAAAADAGAGAAVAQLDIWVTDRARAVRLGPALRDGGCEPGDATTHLALVGPVPVSTGTTLANLEVRGVGPDGLADWARVKLQSFGDTESPPAPDQLAAEVAARQGELALTGILGGWLDRELVAVLAYYTGRDQLVFNLGTRLPYRHRGIGQALLAGWAAAGEADGCRSLIINATDGGRAAALYRRLGFTDEVFWYQKYQLKVPAAR